MPSFTKKAIFLDKDGTLIENEPFNISPQRVRFAADAFPQLRELQNLSFDIYMVTNQPGIALGLFQMNDLIRHLEYISDELHKNGIHVHDVFFCPHHPNSSNAAYRAPCFCRKPNPGMLIKAAYIYHLDLNESWMIGDILDDVEAGRQAGCRTILIDNGNETVWHLTEQRTPDIVCKSLAEATSFILRASDG